MKLLVVLWKRMGARSSYMRSEITICTQLYTVKFLLREPAVFLTPDYSNQN